MYLGLHLADHINNPSSIGQESTEPDPTSQKFQNLNTETCLIPNKKTILRFIVQ